MLSLCGTLLQLCNQYFKLHLLEHLPGGGIFKTLYTPKLIKPYLARKAWTLAASFGSSTFTKKDNCEPNFKNIVKRIGKEVWISPVKSFFEKKKKGWKFDLRYTVLFGILQLVIGITPQQRLCLQRSVLSRKMSQLQVLNGWQKHLLMKAWLLIFEKT